MIARKYLQDASIILHNRFRCQCVLSIWNNPCCCCFYSMQPSTDDLPQEELYAAAPVMWSTSEWQDGNRMTRPPFVLLIWSSLLRRWEFPYNQPLHTSHDFWVQRFNMSVSCVHNALFRGSWAKLNLALQISNHSHALPLRYQMPVLILIM